MSSDWESKYLSLMFDFEELKTGAADLRQCYEEEKKCALAEHERAERYKHLWLQEMDRQRRALFSATKAPCLGWPSLAVNAVAAPAAPVAVAAPLPPAPAPLPPPPPPSADADDLYE